MRSPQRIRLDSRTSSAAWNYAPEEPALVLECEAETGVALLRNQEGIVRMWDDPLAALEWMPRHLAEEVRCSRARQHGVRVAA